MQLGFIFRSESVPLTRICRFQCTTPHWIQIIACSTPTPAFDCLAQTRLQVECSCRLGGKNIQITIVLMSHCQPSGGILTFFVGRTRRARFFRLPLLCSPALLIWGWNRLHQHLCVCPPPPAVAYTITRGAYLATDGGCKCRCWFMQSETYQHCTGVHHLFKCSVGCVPCCRVQRVQVRASRDISAKFSAFVTGQCSRSRRHRRRRRRWRSCFAPVRIWWYGLCGWLRS